MDFICKYIKL